MQSLLPVAESAKALNTCLFFYLLSAPVDWHGCCAESGIVEQATALSRGAAVQATVKNLLLALHASLFYRTLSGRVVSQKAWRRGVWPVEYLQFSQCDRRAQSLEDVSSGISVGQRRRV